MIANIEPIIKSTLLSDDDVKDIFGISSDNELPTHLRLLTKTEGVKREGFYDENRDVWQAPANDRFKIFATPCYPSQGAPEVEEC